MRITFPGRAAAAGLVAGMALALAAPLPASAEPGRAIDYLTQSTDEDAADYLAFLIRSYGCEVRREDRADFNAAIVRFIALDFGLDLSGSGAFAHLDEALDRGLFAFSFRAGPLLVERGELRIERDGTARLTTCGALTS
jgi:hypothetical protein